MTKKHMIVIKDSFSEKVWVGYKDYMSKTMITFVQTCICTTHIILNMKIIFYHTSFPLICKRKKFLNCITMYYNEHALCHLKKIGHFEKKGVAICHKIFKRASLENHIYLDFAEN